eukprot:CAMPEP_0181192498 /NCGR_PEP_ID=MMETSP1096-20121128/13316_1 /TAXON_ID=156174 ORGANISM="Chrysochromulina ericina, Strain CCMP281" /NCGR_SAMPLE_ID=MMETSP1096 /ASSEMBLY_ACC=CAM_ASM_000453 /LENGTH=164 /DNA_ID=CAMNT_0023281899 /DNA_START=179 /DNA_END=674 /DNA_ORIENTATION=-
MTLTSSTSSHGHATEPPSPTRPTCPQAPQGQGYDPSAPVWSHTFSVAAHVHLGDAVREVGASADDAAALGGEPDLIHPAGIDPPPRIGIGWVGAAWVGVVRPVEEAQDGGGNEGGGRESGGGSGGGNMGGGGDGSGSMGVGGRGGGSKGVGGRGGGALQESTVP